MSPGASWSGNPLSGYTSGVAPVTPTDMTGATTNRPMPTAHWFTVPLQSFCDDFTVHVFAGAPNGIASVEFFHENPTSTTVTAPQHNTVVNGTLPLAIQYNTFAITLPASAWCNDATKGGGTKQGATLYAKITAKPVAGVTLFPRIIGPLRICPRFPVNGLPNDKVVLVTPDGKDDSGATVVAPSNGTVVNTIAAAELLISTGAYATSFNPLVKIMKSGNYEVTSQRGWGSIAVAPSCAWTLTHGAGVKAVLTRAAAPSYRLGPNGVNDLNHWHWLMMRGLVEFRDTSGNNTGLVIDHKNIAAIATDSGPSRTGRGGYLYWDNHVKHTLIGVAPALDPTSGLSSPMYNLYWNGGPHPGFALGPNQSDGGVVTTHGTYEWVGALAGDGNDALCIEHTYRETRGNMGVNQQIIVGSYSRGQVTSIFDPGTPDLLTVRGPSGATLAMSGPANARVLTQTDGAGTATINIGFGPGDANYTVAQVAATLASRSGWTASAGTGAALGWTAKWMDSSSTEGGFSVNVSTPLTLVAKQPVHTEWFHIIGFYTVAGAPRVDNLLWMNNVQRKAARWGSAPVQAEGTGSASINRPDNSYIVNNIFESTTYDGDMSAMTGGSFSTVANNFHDIQEGWDGHLNGTDGTSWRGNISTHLVGGNSTAVTTTVVDHCLTPTGSSLTGLSTTNKTLSSATDITNLFVNAAIGDYRVGATSLAASAQFVSPEPYDLFGNLRDPAGDYPGPVSKNQTTAPVWPF